MASTAVAALDNNKSKTGSSSRGNSKRGDRGSSMQSSSAQMWQRGQWVMVGEVVVATKMNVTKDGNNYIVQTDLDGGGSSNSRSSASVDDALTDFCQTLREDQFF